MGLTGGAKAELLAGEFRFPTMCCADGRVLFEAGFPAGRGWDAGDVSGLCGWQRGGVCTAAIIAVDGPGRRWARARAAADVGGHCVHAWSEAGAVYFGAGGGSCGCGAGGRVCGRCGGDAGSGGGWCRCAGRDREALCAGGVWKPGAAAMETSCGGCVARIWWSRLRLDAAGGAEPASFRRCMTGRSGICWRSMRDSRGAGRSRGLRLRCGLETRDEAGQVVSLGTAPVEKDGSFFVQATGDRPLRFILLDAEGRTLRQEQGWFWVRRGEQRICVGCHTGPERAPENRVPEVLLRTTTPVDLTGAAGLGAAQEATDMKLRLLLILGMVSAATGQVAPGPHPVRGAPELRTLRGPGRHKRPRPSRRFGLRMRRRRRGSISHTALGRRSWGRCWRALARGVCGSTTTTMVCRTCMW